VDREEAALIRASVASQLGDTVSEVSLSGSIGRGAPEGGDLDLLVVIKDEVALEAALLKLFGARKDGKKASKMGLINGVQVDLFCCKPETRGAMWLFAMGPGEKNINDRTKAMRKSYKLSEKGLFDRKTGVLIEAADADKIVTLIS
jgi:DNA polymerase/3'-5' exonuclease PolX